MRGLDESPGGPTLDRELRVAKQLAIEAGRILARHRAAGVRRGTKRGGEIVTAADLEADRAIGDGLRREFPGDALLSEESEDDGRRFHSARTWIIDPIDGTQDYADGGDEHTISIGLAIDGRAVLGVVHNPFRRELFAAAEGVPLTLGEAPVRTTGVTSVAEARLTVSGTEWERGQYARVKDALRVRPLSSAAYKLARVAAGLDDATFWVWPRKEWDVCAGVALVLAGGGAVSLLDGSALSFNRRDVRLRGGLLASGAQLHAPLRRELEALGVAPPPVHRPSQV